MSDYANEIFTAIKPIAERFITECDNECQLNYGNVALGSDINNSMGDAIEELMSDVASKIYKHFKYCQELRAVDCDKHKTEQ